MRKFITAAFAAILFVTTPAHTPVQAGNYGFSKPFRKLKVPRVVPRIDRVPDVVVGAGSLPIIGLRRTFGVVAVATVGVAVLGVMSAAEQRDVVRRTARLVSRDLEREVVDTYTIKKGKKRVTIRLSPAQKKKAFQDDPALKPVVTDPNAKPAQDDPNQTDPDGPQPQAEPGNGGAPADPSKPAEVASDDDGRVAIDTLPVDTDCRSMTVEVADAGTTKTDAAPSIEQSNTTIVCKMSEKDWKPVKI